VDNDSNITITFNEVSWKHSNWNDSPPSSNGKMNYIDVEKKLSKQVLKGRITGEELLDLGISGTGSVGDWMRVDPAPVSCVVGYQANGGTPVPAARQLKNITVTLNAACGSVPSPSSKIIPFGSAYGPLPYSSRDKFTFVGWFNARGEQIGTSTPVNDPNNHTLTARWTAIPQAAPAPAKPAPAPTATCTVTFHRNGAPIEAIPQKTAACNSRISLHTPPKWSGKTFVGWNTSGNGTGTAFTVSIPNTSALAVYAIWK